MKHHLQAAFVLAMTSFASPAMAADKTPPASDHNEPMWNLSDLYASPDAWNASHDKLKTQIDGLDKYKGTLGNSAGAMLAALAAISDANRENLRLNTYATLKGDEDVRIAENQERVSASQALQTELNEKTAWLTPEVLAIGADKVKKFESQSPELTKRFAFQLDNILRAGPHTLSGESEGVIAAAGTVLAQPDNIYSVLANGELPFPTVTLSDGTKAHLDQSGYFKYNQVANRADRKKVFDAYWATYKSFEGTFGATLATQVQGEAFQAKARHYPDSLAWATFPDNMPESVYRQLVAQANASLPTLYRYLKLRKRELGIKDELHYYDIYPAMFTLDHPLHFSVPDAERIGLEVTSVYGPEYTAFLKKGFESHWMDVYPRTGKAGGAYMNSGAYDVHPYLHLNHNDDYTSLSTFVHEWGHGIHSLLADETQTFENSNYSTFVAETASIGNEMLLNDYMVAHAKDNKGKLYYLGKGLDLIRSTFYRQTMFAEFQLALHEAVEKGDQLSGEKMTSMYCGLLKKYYGDAEGVTKIDPAYCLEWAFIPHFYYGFYVYQYATSMAGAAQFTNAIETEGTPARDRYIAMLKAGGSDYPLELYKKAGIDMTSPAPYQALVARMNRIMDQIDAIEASRKKQ